MRRDVTFGHVAAASLPAEGQERHVSLDHLKNDEIWCEGCEMSPQRSVIQMFPMRVIGGCEAGREKA